MEETGFDSPSDQDENRGGEYGGEREETAGGGFGTTSKPKRHKQT